MRNVINVLNYSASSKVFVVYFIHFTNAVVVKYLTIFSKKSIMRTSLQNRWKLCKNPSYQNKERNCENLLLKDLKNTKIAGHRGGD